jgi:hypothetical protein
MAQNLRRTRTMNLSVIPELENEAEARDERERREGEAGDRGRRAGRDGPDVEAERIGAWWLVRREPGRQEERQEERNTAGGQGGRASVRPVTAGDRGRWVGVMRTPR